MAARGSGRGGRPRGAGPTARGGRAGAGRGAKAAAAAKARGTGGAAAAQAPRGRSVLPPDAPAGHAAHAKVRVRDGAARFAAPATKKNFQVSVKKALGSADIACQIARAAYVKFENGEPKAEVEKWKRELLQELKSARPACLAASTRVEVPAKGTDSDSVQFEDGETKAEIERWSHEQLEELESDGPDAPQPMSLDSDSDSAPLADLLPIRPRGRTAAVAASGEVAPSRAAGAPALAATLERPRRSAQVPSRAVPSKAEFLRSASPWSLVRWRGMDLPGPLDVRPRRFSKGTLGWYLQGHGSVDLGGVSARCKVVVMGLLFNSSDWPDEPPQPQESAGEGSAAAVGETAAAPAGGDRPEAPKAGSGAPVGRPLGRPPPMVEGVLREEDWKAAWKARPERLVLDIAPWGEIELTTTVFSNSLGWSGRRQKGRPAARGKQLGNGGLQISGVRAAGAEEDLTIKRDHTGAAGFTVLWDPLRRVTNVEPDGPAYRAGMREGQIITHVDGVEVTAETGQEALEATQVPNRTLTIHVKQELRAPCQVQAQVFISGSRPWLRERDPEAEEAERAVEDAGERTVEDAGAGEMDEAAAFVAEGEEEAQVQELQAGLEALVEHDPPAEGVERAVEELQGGSEAPVDSADADLPDADLPAEGGAATGLGAEWHGRAPPRPAVRTYRPYSVQGRAAAGQEAPAVAPWRQVPTISKYHKWFKSMKACNFFEKIQQFPTMLEQYTRLAAQLDEGDSPEHRVVDKVAEMVKQLRRGTERTRVADLGSGEGLLAEKLDRAAFEVTSVDAVQFTPATRVHDLGSLPRAWGGSFDVVVLSRSLWARDYARVLLEARRLLAPGRSSALVVCEPFRRWVDRDRRARVDKDRPRNSLPWIVQRLGFSIRWDRTVSTEPLEEVPEMKHALFQYVVARPEVGGSARCVVCCRLPQRTLPQGFRLCVNCTPGDAGLRPPAPDMQFYEQWAGELADAAVRSRVAALLPLARDSLQDDRHWRDRRQDGRRGEASQPQRRLDAEERAALRAAAGREPRDRRRSRSARRGRSPRGWSPRHRQAAERGRQAAASPGRRGGGRHRGAEGDTAGPRWPRWPRPDQGERRWGRRPGSRTGSRGSAEADPSAYRRIVPQRPMAGPQASHLQRLIAQVRRHLDDPGAVRGTPQERLQRFQLFLVNAGLDPEGPMETLGTPTLEVFLRGEGISPTSSPAAAELAGVPAPPEFAAPPELAGVPAAPPALADAPAGRWAQA